MSGTQRTEPASAPRTLAEDLRARSDVELTALLRDRPDLLTPVPSDLTELATRAGTRASVLRALEQLDRFALQTAEALAVTADGCDPARLGALLPDVDGAAVARAVGRLRELALVWGGPRQLRLVRTARDLLAPTPSAPSSTGLGPSLAEAAAGISPTRMQQVLAEAGLPPTADAVGAVAALTALFQDRARMDALLRAAPAEAVDVLDRLVWGPPYGELGPPADSGVNGAASRPRTDSPVQWLLARALLLPAGRRTVVLPREVALHLRGGRAHRQPQPEPPELAPVGQDPAVVDAVAAGQAFTAVRTVEELLARWDAGGPPVLRAGGLSVRELRRVAAGLEADEASAAFWVELCHGAGLLASDGEADERWAATPAYDAWLRWPTERRWSHLAEAWLAGTRVPGLVGSRDSRGRVLAPLGPDLDRASAPATRRRLLALLADLPEGSRADHSAVLARLRWDRPLRDAAEELRTALTGSAATEAELLGVTGRGALSTPGRALLAGAPAAPALAPLLPEPLDHVLLQADLTAVAPGPLHRTLAAVLDVAAEVESRGGATVYRFTPASVRRALDAGHGAADLHAFLAAHSRTPVPQPLTYLVDDVARRHGRLRVGAASSYLRCDDPALLTELLADRRCAEIGLRRLAPTVVAAPCSPQRLLELLRDLGHAPAAESADGDVLLARSTAHRTPPRAAPVPVTSGPPTPDDRLLAAAVRAARAGDGPAAPPRPATGPAAGPPRSVLADTRAALQAAVLAGTALSIGCVGADGTPSQHVVTPVRVEGGTVTAYDHATDRIRTFPLHRITGATELEDEPA